MKYLRNPSGASGTRSDYEAKSSCDGIKCRGQISEKHVMETGVSTNFAVMGIGKRFESPGLWESYRYVQ